MKIVIFTGAYEIGPAVTGRAVNPIAKEILSRSLRFGDFLLDFQCVV